MKGAATLSKSSVLTLKIGFVAVCVAIVYFRLASGYCWYVLAALTAVAAMWRGRRDERAVAAVITLATLAGMLTLPGYLHKYRLAALAIDTVEAVVLVAIAVRSRLWWPSWCAAFHIGAVANHVAFNLWPNAIEPWSYVSGIYIWGWLGLIPLCLGTFDAWLARRQPPIVTPIPDGATRR